MTQVSTLRVRIAPSPTGLLHIGTTRTALFNFLFARHEQGVFVMRIEDTDKQRSKSEYTENILSGLKALGLTWDEGPDAGGDYGPYAQSERGELYLNALEKLLSQEKAYPCFCTPEELQAERQAAEQEKKTYTYSGKCRDLSSEEIQAKRAAGASFVYRLKVPDQPVVFDDMIRDRIEIHSNTIGDIIIAKGDKSPIYNFAVVVDDLHMQISHVIRGEDHISNTPKQILIYQALGATPPQFAHTAMMLAPDRSKLSKRHGATAIADYLEQGYLPEALVNYLALLGWAAPEGREVLSLDELIELFSMDKVTKSGAVFDQDKLKWMNGQWLRRLDKEALVERVTPYLEKANLTPSQFDEPWLQAVLLLLQEKVSLLTDFAEQGDFLFQDTLNYDSALTDKAFKMASARDVLNTFARAIEANADWSEEAIHAIIQELKDGLSFKMKEIMWPLRAALSGRTFGPDLQQIILLLGDDRVKARIAGGLAEVERLAHA